MKTDSIARKTNYKLIVGVNDLATVRPDLAAQWDERNPKSPQDYTAGSEAKVWWKSECGLSWQATISSRNHGRGDPYLSGRLPIPGKTDLATVRPDLAAAWDFTLNESSPQDYTVHSGAKVWWKSECGLSWQATIASRTSGTGDPYLSGKLPIPGKTDLATVRPDLAAAWDFTLNELSPQDYTAHSRAKVWWKSECGLSWQASIDNRVRGRGDPYLSGKLPIPGKTDLATVRPDLAAAWDFTLNESSPQNYTTGSGAKVWWKSECGLSWQATIASRVKGCGDPYLSGRLPIPGKTDLATVRPDLADQWDANRNYPKTPRDFAAHSDAKVWWKSAYCGLSWQASISHRTRKRGTGDPYLSGRLPIPGKTDLATVRPDLADQWDTDRNFPKTPRDYTAQSHVKVWWKSECGLSWKAAIRDRVRGNGDPYLSGRLPIPGKTDLATVRPDLAAQWDARNSKSPQDYTAGSNAKVWWKSAYCGLSWQASICSRTRGAGDPYLAGQLPIPGKTDLATVRPDLAAAWDPCNEKTPQDYTANSEVKVWWRCPECGNRWYASIEVRNRDASGCKMCWGQRHGR